MEEKPIRGVNQSGSIFKMLFDFYLITWGLQRVRLFSVWGGDQSQRQQQHWDVWGVHIDPSVKWKGVSPACWPSISSFLRVPSSAFVLLDVCRSFPVEFLTSTVSPFPCEISPQLSSCFSLLYSSRGLFLPLAVLWFLYNASCGILWMMNTDVAPLFKCCASNSEKL